MAEKITITQITPTPTNPSGIIVNKDRFEVSKANDPDKLEVEWLCKTSDFTIEFENGNSPFTRPVFSGLAGKSISSGAVDSSPSHNVQPSSHNYKYSIKIGTKPPLDPGGVVNP